MKIRFLFSSSEGNCSVIESSGGKRIVIDAGVSYKKLTESYGEPLIPDALFITHEHGDHVLGAGVLARKTGCPVFIPEKSYEVVYTKFKNCPMISMISGGQCVIVGDLVITAFSTQHDSKDSVGYIIQEGGKKFGYITDTGNISKLMRSKLEGCDAYFIEADYEEELLWNYDDYTVLMKERISCDFGHLSNDQALDFVETLDLSEVEWITLGHLSKHTNSPDLLREKFSKRFPEHKDKLHLAPQEQLLTL